jgi:hypothetical protein
MACREREVEGERLWLVEKHIDLSGSRARQRAIHGALPPPALVPPLPRNPGKGIPLVTTLTLVLRRAIQSDMYDLGLLASGKCEPG